MYYGIITYSLYFNTTYAQYMAIHTSYLHTVTMLRAIMICTYIWHVDKSLKYMDLHWANIAEFCPIMLIQDPLTNQALFSDLYLLA